MTNMKRPLALLLFAALLLSLMAGCTGSADETPPPAQIVGSDPPSPTVDVPGSGVPITADAAPSDAPTDIERYVAEAVGKEALVGAEYLNAQQYGAASRVSIERLLDLFFLLARAQFEQTDDVDFSPFWDPESEHQQSLLDFVEDLRSYSSPEAPVLWSNFYGLTLTPEEYVPQPGEPVELTVRGTIMLLYPASSLISGMASPSGAPYAVSWPINHRIVLALRDNRWYITEIEFLDYHGGAGSP